MKFYSWCTNGTMNLRNNGYDITETECSVCESGTLWVNSFEILCDNCGRVVRKSDAGFSHEPPWKYYRDNQDEYTYDNSERTILPGGFARAYRGDGLYGEPDE